MSHREEIIGPHRLILGDCREIELPRDAAVVSDPPYGMNWNTNTSRFSGGDRQSVARRSRGRDDWGDVANDDKPFDPRPWLGYPVVVLWFASAPVRVRGVAQGDGKLIGKGGEVTGAGRQGVPPGALRRAGPAGLPSASPDLRSSRPRCCTRAPSRGRSRNMRPPFASTRGSLTRSRAWLSPTGCFTSGAFFHPACPVRCAR